MEMGIYTQFHRLWTKKLQKSRWGTGGQTGKHRLWTKMLLKQPMKMGGQAKNIYFGLESFKKAGENGKPSPFPSTLVMSQQLSEERQDDAPDAVEEPPGSLQFSRHTVFPERFPAGAVIVDGVVDVLL